MVGQVILLFSLRVTPLSLDQGCLYANPNWHVPLHWVRTKWMKRFWQHLESGWNVYMCEYEYYTVLYVYIYVSIYIYIYSSIMFIWYIYIPIYLAVHLWYTCGSDNKRNMYPALYCVVKAQRLGDFNAPFSGRRGTLGPGWHNTHPKKLTKKCNKTDLFNIFFFVSPARPGHGNSASYFFESMDCEPKISMVSRRWFRMPLFPRICWSYLGSSVVYPTTSDKVLHGVNGTEAVYCFWGMATQGWTGLFFSK